MAYLTSKTGKKVAKIVVERDHGTEKNVYLLYVSSQDLVVARKNHLCAVHQEFRI